MSRLVVAVGDSITYAEHLPREQAWTTLLSDRLGCPVLNKGVCADTTRLGLERFPRDVQEPLAAHDGPATVVIQFGANDANRWVTDRGHPRVSRPAFIANLSEMVDRARVFGADDIVLCTIARHERGARLAEDCERYSVMIRALGRALGLDVFDVEALGPLSYLDGLHLDALANARYAEGLGGVIERAWWREAVAA